MGENGQGRHRQGRPTTCRAWADGLDDDAVEELRRRVEQDATVAAALLFAHAGDWEAAPSKAETDAR